MPHPQESLDPVREMFLRQELNDLFLGHAALLGIFQDPDDVTAPMMSVLKGHIPATGRPVTLWRAYDEDHGETTIVNLNDKLYFGIDDITANRFTRGSFPRMNDDLLELVRRAIQEAEWEDLSELSSDEMFDQT